MSDELAPGIRQEVIDNGYSHAEKIMAALARNERRKIPKVYIWDPVGKIHIRIFMREEGR